MFFRLIAAILSMIKLLYPVAVHVDKHGLVFISNMFFLFVSVCTYFEMMTEIIFSVCYLYAN